MFQVSLALGLEPGTWTATNLSQSDKESDDPSHFPGADIPGLSRRCGVCLANFPSTWLLERHAVLQHANNGSPGSAEEKPFTCEQCGQRYRYRSAYVKHREQNHRARLPADKLFTCDVCGMQFRYLKSFKKHRLNHALERLQRGNNGNSLDGSGPNGNSVHHTLRSHHHHHDRSDQVCNDLKMIPLNFF